MRKLLRLWACVLVFLLCLSPLAAALPVTVYLNDPCGGCASTVPGCGECSILLELSNRLGQELRKYTEDGTITLKYRNLEEEGIFALYTEDLARFSAENAQNDLPVYIIGDAEYGSIFIGDTPSEKLAEAIEAASSRQQELGIAEEEPEEEIELVSLPRQDSVEDVRAGDSTILYFYKPTCPYCMEIKALIHAIPLEIPLADGSISRVRLIGLNKEDPEELKIVKAYYDLLEVDEERQYVPMLIVGNKDLFLYEEIVPELLPALLAGEGRNTSLAPFNQ